MHQRYVDTKKWYYTVYCTGVLAYTDRKKSVKIEIAKNIFLRDGVKVIYIISLKSQRYMTFTASQ